MPDLLWRFLAGLVAAAGVAALAWRRRSLTADGAGAATLVGAVVVGGGGWWWGGLVVAFFATSSALSRLGRSSSSDIGGGPRDIVARGSERDAVQVAANGGIAALLALLAWLWPDRGLCFYAGFAGALAAATADTWATEVGARSPSPPRLVVGGRRVSPGTSGGVTPLGSLAGVVGACFLAALAAAGLALGMAPGRSAVLFGAVAIAGLAGSLVDSLLGATVQAAYRCPACDLPTEHLIHRCGTPTRLVRGLPFLTNDAVNFVATASGALIGGVASKILG